ncbi:MAG: 4-hydroxyphenylpyruvate dioxygenase [Planctomycetota bacterium]|jgi:4-hydroxyphenylpyruvate dioxygenase
MGNSLPIERIHHIELIVGNALQAAYFYRKAFGFDQIAYLGPETGYPDRASYVLKQNDIQLVLSTPLLHDDPRNVFLTLHGDSVKDICFEVADVDAVFNETVERGAVPVFQPLDRQDEGGKVRMAAICTYGDTVHTFLDRNDYDGPFLPGFRKAQRTGQGVGLLRVDHVVGNAEDRQMDRWADFYIDTFGFHQFVSYDDKDISTEYSALRSKVVASDNRKIKFPINEPAKGLRKSQIQEYIDYHYSAGVQHIALFTDNIIDTVSKLRKKGVKFLLVPKAYYDTVWDRVGDIKEDRDRIAENQILVDSDENGYLLQIFTKPVQDRPTLFFEVIQREGCESFGKGNFKALFISIEQEQARRGNL